MSQEILVRDTRFDDAPENMRSNVFTNILQPIKVSKQNNTVQAEIHSRKRQDKQKFTVLLNNMRLMAVFDWWELAREFILEDSVEKPSSPSHYVANVNERKNDQLPFELKLNITDSEIVVVEDTSHWDTNAVILKSTTVITYKPNVIEKPLSCNLNNCEVYSCILDKEDETALSIIDPVTLNIEINRDRTLEVQLQTLMVRLSYYDMKMFMSILNSLPKQMFKKKDVIPSQPANMKQHIHKLTALGFSIQDCVRALELCDMKLDDAALWLTQNAVSNFTHGGGRKDEGALDVCSVEVNIVFLIMLLKIG